MQRGTHERPCGHTFSERNAHFKTRRWLGAMARAPTICQCRATTGLRDRRRDQYCAGRYFFALQLLLQLHSLELRTHLEPAYRGRHQVAGQKSLGNVSLGRLFSTAIHEYDFPMLRSKRSRLRVQLAARRARRRHLEAHRRP